VVKGEATIDGRMVTQYTRPIPLRIAPLPFLLSSTLSRVAVSVLPPGSESAAGEAATTIKVDRRDGFKEELRLTIEGMPSGVRTELSNIGSNATETVLKIFATDKAVAGTNVFTVVGTAMHKDHLYTRKTGQVTLTVSVPAPAELPKAPVASASVKDGKDAAGTK
jgi:hypothetical protein